jgi:hypothetical protein
MSYTMLKASAVRAACQEYLNNRNLRIANKRDQLIRAAMQPRWFRRGRTYEEAKQLLENGDLFSEYHLASISGGAWPAKVEQLYDLAKIAGDGTVMVDAKHASLIADYFTPAK